MTIPKRMLGTTGVDVSIIGLGGEGVLRTYGYDKGAYALINRAIDLGINYCESARAFSPMEGREKDDLIDTLRPFGRELMYYKP